MKNLNNNNSQVKGGNQMQMNINNFWNMVSEMNEIHNELWDNRYDEQLAVEPDAGTLEILANCDAIEAALENQNQIEAENQSQVKTDSRKEFEAYMAELERWLEEDDKWEAEYEAQCIQEALEEALADEIEYQQQCLLDELIEAELNIEARIKAWNPSIQADELDRLVQAEMLDPGYLDTCIQDAGTGSDPVYFADDMDEIDRRTINRIMEARREVA